MFKGKVNSRGTSSSSEKIRSSIIDKGLKFKALVRDYPSDDECVDFPPSNAEKKREMPLISKKLKKYLKDNKIDITSEESRPYKLLGQIRLAFKYGTRVDKYIYNWLRNQRKDAKAAQINDDIDKVVIDPVIQKMFTQPNYVQPKHINRLTQILSKNIDDDIREYYYDIELLNIKNLVTEQVALGDIQRQILQLPVSCRLQGMLLICENPLSNETKLNVIQNILIPTLKDKPQYQGLKKAQIIQIYDTFKGLDFSKLLDEQSALAMIQLFQYGKIIDYDLIRNNCQRLSKEFWLQVFEQLDIQPDLQDIFIDNIGNLFTNDVKVYINKNLLNPTFIKTLSFFKALNTQQITELSKYQSHSNYNILFSYLDAKMEKIEFNEYIQKMAKYVQFEGDLSLELKQQLKTTSFYQWHNYHGLLKSGTMNSNAKAIDIIKEILKNQFSKYDLSLPKKTQITEYTTLLTKQIELLKLKFKSFLSLEWQKYLIMVLYHLVQVKNRKSVSIKLATGHGKSIIIQLLAQMLGTKVLIVCSNTFLQYWSKQLYQVVENKNIQYVSINEFLRMKVDQNATVIVDEIDLMNGQNSFYIDNYNKEHKSYYLQSVLKQYKNWIGFSATFTECGRECTFANFPDSTYIEIENISEKAVQNGLIAFKVFKGEDDKFKKIQEAINDQKELYKSFIVILEDKEEAKRFYEYYMPQKPQVKLYHLINEFTQYKETMSKVQSLMQGDFIVVTTKEGGIGIDFRGIDVAHVVIAFEYNNFAELNQALGRGSRHQHLKSTGTVICKEEPSSSIGDLIEQEMQDDAIKADNIRLMEKVARLMHGQVINDEDLQVFRDFRTRMQKGWNFYREIDVADNAGVELFENIKNIVDPGSKYMKNLNEILEKE